MIYDPKDPEPESLPNNKLYKLKNQWTLLTEVKVNLYSSKIIAVFFLGL